MMLMLVPKKALSSQLIEAETQIEEPISPKISCMGRIKHKERQRNSKRLIEGSKTKTSPLRAFFSRPQEKKSGAPRPRPKVPEKRSGRKMAAGFDWRTQVATMGAKHRNIYHSSEDKIQFSASFVIDHLKPREDINIWRRRTVAQLRPLQVASLR